MTHSMQWSAVIARVRNRETTLADANYLEAMRSGLEAQARAGRKTSAFNGRIDEINIYDRVLPAGEIAKLYRLHGNKIVAE